MLGAEWRKSIHEFYTHEGATALGETLKTWEGGRLVVQIVEMPIKCPVAPLEFTFLADSFFAEQGLRDQVEITYVTPLDGAFTKPVASKHLGSMLDERKVALEADFMLERIDTDGEEKKLVSYDEREIPFDLLVTIPVNMGADFVARSGLGDEFNYVRVDKDTLQSTQYENVFAVGDASDIPASKAGSVAHFAMDLFTENFVRHVQGLEMLEQFDGHANCFIESGHGKGMLIDFNYDTEPLPGKYPLPDRRPLQPAEGDRDEPLGQDDVPLDVLERPAPRQGASAPRAHVDGRQGDGGRVMTTTTASPTVDEQLDLLMAQVAAMSEQLARERAAREQWADLTSELMPVASGAMAIATRELEDLSADVTSEDLARFARTMARSLPTVERLVSQLDAVTDLAETVTSLGGPAMARLTEHPPDDGREGLLRVRPRGRPDRRPRRHLIHRGRRAGARRQRRADPQHRQADDPARDHGNAAPHHGHVRQEAEDHHGEPPSTFALIKSMRDPETPPGPGATPVDAALHGRGIPPPYELDDPAALPARMTPPSKEGATCPSPP